MNKCVKIAVSLLLVLTIVLNPFCSLFDVCANASTTAVAFGTWFIDFLAEQFVYQLGNQMWQEAINNPDGVYNAFKLSMFSNFEYFVTGLDDIQVDYDVIYDVSYVDGYKKEIEKFEPKSVYIDPVKLQNMSEEQRQKNQLIVDTCNEFLANGGNPDLVFYNIGNAYGFDVTSYEKVKEGLSNQLFGQMAQEGIIDMVDAGVLPTYDFNFVGPMPSISYPVTSGFASLQKNGFIFTAPININSFENNTLSSESAAKLIFADYVFQDISVSGNDDVGYNGIAYVEDYGHSVYALYNGVMYYYTPSDYSSTAKRHQISSRGLSSYSPTVFRSVDGTKLSDVYAGDGYLVGYAVNKTGEVQSASPIVKNVDENEFTQTTGGGTVEIPLTDDEQAIADGLGLGIISPDSMLEIGADGSIISADSIELAKLQELCDLIKSGNLQFENVQEYLDLITKLVGAGNLTATQQKVILENINANVATLTDVFTSEFDSSVDISVDDVVVSSGGFNEAYQLIEVALPVVNQCKDLIYNLMDWNDNQQSPPDFSFYWDSNKDGEVEEYTVLDLSFMEQTLTNSNLVDKKRFANPMTIREFVQSLIVLITYAVFAIKILRKIPSLVGASEGVNDDVKTVSDHYENMHLI